MAMIGRPPKVNSVTRHKRKNGDIQTIETDMSYTPTLLKLFPKQINYMDTREVEDAKELKLTKQSVALTKSLIDYPLCRNLLEAQWIFLSTGICLYDMSIKTGDLKYLKEARVWFKEFGITPEAVLKQRISFADANLKEMESYKAKEKQNLSAREMFKKGGTES